MPGNPLHRLTARHHVHRNDATDAGARMGYVLGLIVVVCLVVMAPETFDGSLIQLAIISIGTVVVGGTAGRIYMGQSYDSWNRHRERLQREHGMTYQEAYDASTS